MSSRFLIYDPESAREYLRDMPPSSKRKGEAAFREGLVVDLHPEVEGTSYACRVLGAKGPMHVTMEYNDEDGWDAECSCPETWDCEHVFAAMSALLSEHRVLEVQNLSAGVRPLPAPGVAREDDPKQLEKRLVAALGRSLTRSENDLVRLVQACYTRAASHGQALIAGDFARMGMPLPGAVGWAPLNVWPELPASDYELWLYIAAYARKQGVKIPTFMEPITDYEFVETRIREWERGMEVRRWQGLLASREMAEPPPAPAIGPVDLRVMIIEDSAHLEILQPGRQSFEPLKAAACRRLLDASAEGRVQFGPEAQVLWQLFRPLDGEVEIYLETGDEIESEILAVLLRLPMLESRIVDTDGRPLARMTEPLKWELSIPDGLSRDYVLELKQPSGAKSLRVLRVLPGNPPLYLTAHAIYPGPPIQQFLKRSVASRIPAEALESEAGVGLLQDLGVELPQPLRERVQKIAYEVRIKARLAPPEHGFASEQCVLEIQAASSAGDKLSWDGYGWSGSPRSMRPPLGNAKPGAPIVVRDTAILRQLPALLEPLKLKSQGFRQPPSARVTKQFPALFTEWLKALPPQVNVELQGELASLTAAEVSGQVKLEVSEAEIDWFDLRVVLEVSDTELTQEEIKLLLNARGQFVRLKGKGWRRLKYALTDEDDQRLARLGLNPRELTSEPQRLHALQLADNAARRFLPEDQVEEVQRRAGEIRTRVAPPLPAGVTAQLRPYQLEGFHFLAYLSSNRFGGILADDMGLGKTLQTLAWLLWLREQTAPGTRPGPSLVVCPKSVMDNWHAEAARFTPELRVRHWSASELPAFKDKLDSADLHVLNYSQLRILGETLAPVKWLAVILDEGQYIKNPSSQTAQVARALQSGHRLVLSGTPIENRLLDLWSLMAFSMPGILGSRAQFAKLYDAKGDPFARQRLAARVRPFLLRRTKSQVAKDLPDRVEEDLFCEIEGEQQALYRAELKRAQQMLLSVHTREELAREQFNFLASLLRLRQICCHPRLVHPGSKETGAKTEALLDQLEPLMEEGHKVLVFSQFVELLNLLKPLIEEREWPCFYLAGDTENRGELVKSFQSKEGSAVFLISLKAGGFGLNLTAASYVVLFDPWWNPAVENQAIDRTHRIGQVNKVMAYRLLIKNSVEEKIRHLQKQKKAMAEDVLGEEKFAQGLSMEDFAFLFAD